MSRIKNFEDFLRSIGVVDFIVVDLQYDFTSLEEELESIWKRVEEKEKFEKIHPLVMTCVVNSERFSEYVYVEPKLLTM
jgi:hypothetical protein